jgi:NADH-quinone oxidoreductase subunit H
METLFTLDNVWLALLLKVVAVLIIFLTVPLVMGYMEHKVLAHMQARLGPMEALPHGVGQLVADGIKFLQKENVVPAAADKWVFNLAPGVMLIPAIVVLTVVPFGPGAFAENLDAGIFFALAVSSIGTIGLLMAGWSSANKYSLMGGLRGAAQLIAYELPMVLAAAAIVLQAETLSLVGIVEAQADFRFFGTLTIPYAVPHAFGLALFFMSAVAELNRPPFDMPIADAELIAGHMTEYTGIRFAFFLLSEYAGMVVFGALATVLFLGGWYPWPGYLLPEGFLGVVVGFGTTIGKIAAFMFLFIWLRATFPRLREDQLQRMSWLILIPLALLNIVIVAIAKVVA